MPTKQSSSWSQRAADAAYATGASAVVFLVVVAAGCAYIVAAKLVGIGPFYVTFVPVGTIEGVSRVAGLTTSLLRLDCARGGDMGDGAGGGTLALF